MSSILGGLFQSNNANKSGGTDVSAPAQNSSNTTTTTLEDVSKNSSAPPANGEKKEGVEEAKSLDVKVDPDKPGVNPIKQADMDALSHFDERASGVLAQALQETKKIKQPLIEPEQLFLGLLTDREVFKLLQEFNVDVAKLTRELEGKEVTGTFTGEPTLGEESKHILEESFTASKKRNAEFISPEDILLTFFNRENLAAAAPLKAQGVQKEKVQERLSKSTEYTTGKKSVLAQYGVDLTQKAKDGKLDPVTGRDVEIQRLTHILLRRTKNNPIIIGEPGVGKTAIVEGVAQMIADGKVANELGQKRIIQLDVSNLIAGASHRGEFEERLQSVIKEAMASEGQIILFIDEIHTLIGAGDSGGAMDASNIIKPYLSRGQLQVIGTTTTSEYRKNFEKDRAFERRFQTVLCDEPSEDVAIQMIKILQPKYESYHKVTFTEEAVKSAVHLSKRYIGERFLPDKAIDLMDEAAAEVKLRVGGGSGVGGGGNNQTQPANGSGDSQNSSQPQSNPQGPQQQQNSDPNQPQVQAQNSQNPASDQNSQQTTPTPAPPPPTSANGNPLVQPGDIESVVSRWTGIPITKLTEKESEKLLHLEELIHKGFINHERAVKAVSEAVRRGRIGLANANRPIASFIFLGPTGTGKTELAKILAEIMFGRKDAMIRLDMSEYMEKHEVAKLVGAPPGYVGYEEGGQLTEAVRTKPYSIVLLDEIEKAHPDVFNILLQLLEDGRLTDNKGNTISFKNTVVIATSNVASSIIQQKLSESARDQASNTANPGQPGNPAAQNPNTTAPGGTSTPGTNPSQSSAVGGVSANGIPTDPPPPVQDPNGMAQNSNTTQPNGMTPTQTGAGQPQPATPQTPEEKQASLYKELSSLVMGELTQHFKPELINRFDEVVVFEPLTKDNMLEIARLGIENTKKMLKDQNIDMQISQGALQQLATDGFDPAYGARPLRRLIQRVIENPLAIYLINKSINTGDTVLVDYDSSQDKFVFKKAPSANPSANNVSSSTPASTSSDQTPQSTAPEASSSVETSQDPAPTEPPQASGVSSFGDANAPSEAPTSAPSDTTTNQPQGIN